MQAACLGAGKPCGIFAARQRRPGVYAESGFKLIAVGMDCSILLEGYSKVRDTVRARALPGTAECAAS